MGDTAEQDLELYAGIARERPAQILAIFVRDASTQFLGGALERGTKPLDDPTGEQVFEQGGIPRMPFPPQPPSRANSGGGLEPPSRSLSDGPGLNAPSYARYVPRRARRTVSEEPAPIASMPILPTQSFTSIPPRTSPLSEEPLLEEPARNGPPSRTQQQLYELEKRRAELQLRIYRARLEIPRHIQLRVFRSPQECMEATEILNTLQL